MQKEEVIKQIEKNLKGLAWLRAGERDNLLEKLSSLPTQALHAIEAVLGDSKNQQIVFLETAMQRDKTLLQDLALMLKSQYEVLSSEHELNSKFGFSLNGNSKSS